MVQQECEEWIEDADANIEREAGKEEQAERDLEAATDMASQVKRELPPHGAIDLEGGGVEAAAILKSLGDLSDGEINECDPTEINDEEENVDMLMHTIIDEINNDDGNTPLSVAYAARPAPPHTALHSNLPPVCRALLLLRF